MTERSGERPVEVSVQVARGQIFLQFNQSIQWLVYHPSGARALARELLRVADELDPPSKLWLPNSLTIH